MIGAPTNFDRRQLYGVFANFTPMLRDVRARVLIADDHPSFLRRIVKLLEDEFVVVGAVSSGTQLVFAAGAMEPDALVIDFSMPDMTGLEALDMIRARGSQVPVVFLTAWNEPEIIAAAWDSGALGFVIKSSVASDLVCAIRAALQGVQFVSPTARRRIAQSA